MRIVAGTHKGRPLKAPKGVATRPTSDRVREAIFSAVAARLGSDLAGVRVLDAYAGSGALGLEALSRGAAHATYVEREPSAQRALRANVVALQFDDFATVVGGDVDRLAARGAIPGGPFSLILLDPPYRIDEAEVRALIEALEASGALADGCLLVWEHDAARPIQWPSSVGALSERRYGSTGVSLGAYEEGVTA